MSTSAFRLDGNTLSITDGGIALPAPLGFELTDGYLIETRMQMLQVQASYGGVGPLISSSPFTAGGNGNADATAFWMRVGGSGEVAAWIGDGSVSSYNIGAQLFAGWQQVPSVWNVMGIDIDSSSVRFVRDGAVLIERTGIGWRRPVRYIALGHFDGNAGGLQPTVYDWIRVRKAGAQPVVTLGSRSASGINAAGAFGIGLSPDEAQGTVGNTRLSTSTLPGWRHILLRVDSPTVELWVDGTLRATGSHSGSIITPTRELRISDFLPAVHAADEVRISAAARSPEWIALQLASMLDAVLTFSPSETRAN